MLALGGLAVLGTAGYLLRRIFNKRAVFESVLEKSEQVVTNLGKKISLDKNATSFVHTNIALPDHVEAFDKVAILGAKNILEEANKDIKTSQSPQQDTFIPLGSANSVDFFLESKKSRFLQQKRIATSITREATISTVSDQVLEVNRQWSLRINMTELFDGSVRGVSQ